MFVGGASTAAKPAAAPIEMKSRRSASLWNIRRTTPTHPARAGATAEYLRGEAVDRQ